MKTTTSRKVNRPLVVLLLGLCAALAPAAERVPLWPDGAPHQEDHKDTETHPNTPTLDLYPVGKDKSTGVAVLVCPGGGYGNSDAPQELTDRMSNENHVTDKTPPVFLFHTTDDPVVKVENSIRFFLACRKAGVPAELHTYRTGPHGVGLAQNKPLLKTWPNLLVDWMQGLKLLPKQP